MDEDLQVIPGTKSRLIITFSVICIGATVLVAVWYFPRLKKSTSYRQWKASQRVVEGANWFHYPVGDIHGQGYYVALEFREEEHLGEDWNGLGGGDSDLGDPVFAIADGKVLRTEHAGPGWGNVVMIDHTISQSGQKMTVVALYGHLQSVDVQPGDMVKARHRIGTIGNADGRYLAHLHLELRDDPSLDIGGGYGYAKSKGYLSPSDFIHEHRRRPSENVHLEE